MKAQDQKELMRERICDCAKRLFEREGYEQVSMRQIAAEAGIAVGNLTYYFSKKEDLLKESLNDIQETFSESIQLFEIDPERGEISGKPFWEYENRTLLELLLRFLKTVDENLIYLIKLLTFFGRKCMEIRSMKKNNLQKESADF